MGEVIPERNLTVGVLQFAPQKRTLSENVRFIHKQVRSLSHAIIVLPEFFLGSYTNHPLFFLQEEELSELLSPLLEVSKRKGVSLVGSLPIETDGTSYNRAVLIHEGEIRALYDKSRLFGDEIHRFSLGEPGSEVVAINGVKCSVRICMDIFDPLPGEESDEVMLILGPSAVSVDHLRAIHKARALENQALSVFCNRSGHEPSNMTRYLGRSAIFYPDGREEEVGESEELKTFELRSDEIRAIESRKNTFRVSARSWRTRFHKRPTKA